MTTWGLATLPMDSATNNWLFLYNEFFVLFACDFVLVFTAYTSERDLNKDIEYKYEIGYLYIGIQLASALINIVLLVIIIVLDLKKAFLKWKLKKQYLRTVIEQ